MIRLLGLGAGLLISVFGLSLNWVDLPEQGLNATGFETLNLASAFLVVLGLGVFMLFYFKQLAQRVLSGLLILVSGYLMFISANSLLNSDPIIDRIVSVTGAVGVSAEVVFNSLAIAIYFIGLALYSLTLAFNMFKPRQSRGSKRISKSEDSDDPIGLWDSQS